ncbi:SMC-Scp complex subunit ScpB [Thermomonas brevis]|uniref:SMC-Scp complex subunit ScpB n=1 Tax=Thermomonas brevis TaxID=215691 RepID=A0A7G9QXJ9_9GAMM|nr:SMC-Scp complex subunit ScpB [Thermomonas brevis]
MDQSLVTRVVEAALLASSQPLTLVQLKGLFPLDEPVPDGSVEAALAELQAACAPRGVELVEVASGWRFQVQADVHPWVARLWSERQTKYTRATLETLALIAYRQPITRGEIEQIRGVTVNSSIIKALEEREWIRVVGHRDVPGKPELLATTKTFLDYFGLKRLDELPPLSELKDIGELEPQLPFAPAIPAGMTDAAPVSDEAASASDGAQSETDAIPAADTAEQPDADADTEARETPDDAAEPDDALAPTHDTNTDPLGDDANSSADSRASSEQKDEQ